MTTFRILYYLIVSPNTIYFYNLLLLLNQRIFWDKLPTLQKNSLYQADVSISQTKMYELVLPHQIQHHLVSVVPEDTTIQILKSLIKMVQCLHITYVHPLTYFKSSLDHLQYPSIM